MNDYEVRDLYNQVQVLEEQVQLLVEALIANTNGACCQAKKTKVKKEKSAKLDE
tara:strand:- start:861 stop:1022 length:162 start_codon:yes stop_codon:yes gene_type:complete